MSKIDPKTIQMKERVLKSSGKKFRLKENLTVPAGTVLEERLGTTTYVKDCYEMVFALSKDTVGKMVYIIDMDDFAMNDIFEEIKD